MQRHYNRLSLNFREGPQVDDSTRRGEFGVAILFQQRIKTSHSYLEIFPAPASLYPTFQRCGHRRSEIDEPSRNRVHRASGAHANAPPPCLHLPMPVSYRWSCAERLHCFHPSLSQDSPRHRRTTCYDAENYSLHTLNMPHGPDLIPPGAETKLQSLYLRCSPSCFLS